MKLPHTEVKFYPKVKSQTGLSSLQRALMQPKVWSKILFLIFKKKEVTPIPIYSYVTESNHPF